MHVTFQEACTLQRSRSVGSQECPCTTVTTRIGGSVLADTAKQSKTSFMPGPSWKLGKCQVLCHSSRWTERSRFAARLSTTQHFATMEQTSSSRPSLTPSHVTADKKRKKKKKARTPRQTPRDDATSAGSGGGAAPAAAAEPIARKPKRRRVGSAASATSIASAASGASASGAGPSQAAPDAGSSLASRTGRGYTVSIAIPGSIVDNAQSPELQAYLTSQIARALAIFCVDEVVVFNESSKSLGDGTAEAAKAAARGWNPNEFLARLLQYQETPQSVVHVRF